MIFPPFRHPLQHNQSASSAPLTFRLAIKFYPFVLLSCGGKIILYLSFLDFIAYLLHKINPTETKNTAMNPKTIKVFFLSILCMMLVAATQAASLVQGRIYLKDGSIIECAEKDRLKIPKHSQNVKLLRRAYYKDKSKEIYAFEAIDSIVCWHPSAPEHPRKFIPVPKIGWLWVHLETPHICAGVYSSKGYGIDTNGGIEVWMKQRYLSRSKTAYYLRKTGDSEFHDMGSASRNAKNVFRERIAEYISDDPVLADQILESNTSNRSKTILMLQKYNPIY